MRMLVPLFVALPTVRLQLCFRPIEYTLLFQQTLPDEGIFLLGSADLLLKLLQLYAKVAGTTLSSLAIAGGSVGFRAPILQIVDTRD